MSIDGTNMRVGAEADFKDLISNTKKASTSINHMMQNFNKLAASMDEVTKGLNKHINQQGVYRGALNKLNKEKQEAYLTNKRLMQSETLLSAIYTKNSAIAQKRYLTSLTGLRQGLFRFRQESEKIVIAEKGHLSMLNAQENAMKRFYIQGNMVSRTLDNMSTKYLNLGKNLQWTGRQLMVGVTLPLMGMSAAAVKSYLEWDKAITRTSKLLDDQVDKNGKVVKTAKDISKELQQAATDLSQGNKGKGIKGFGISRSEIMDQMGIFAQIGLNTRNEIEKLAKMSLEFNILGDLNDTAKAAEMTRVVFQGFNAELGNTNAAINETQKTLEMFNVIEDETSLSMDGIAEAMPKVTNSAKQLGMTLPEVAGFLAAMTQNGIDAGEAANALRFALVKMPAAGAYMESPLLSGMAKARLKELTAMVETYNGTVSEADRLDLFGPNGQFKGGTEMLLQLSKAWGTMGDDMRIAFSRALTGTTQAERLGTLLTNVERSMNSSSKSAQDFYKVFNVIDDPSNAKAKWVSQLEEVLGSDAYEWARIVEGVRNTVQDLGKELSAVLIPMAHKFTGWLEQAIGWFKGLDDGTKKWLVTLGLFATIIGPITYGFGQLVILAMQLVKASFTKPLKAFFHLGTVLKGVGDQSGQAQAAIAKLFSDFEGRKIDSKQLIDGIEETMRKEVMLRGEVEKTTAALAAQGMVDATPNIMGTGGAVGAQQAKKAGLRATLANAWKRGIVGTGLGGIVAPTNAPRVATPTYSLDELQAMFPEAVEEATRKVRGSQYLGSLGGRGLGDVTDQDVLDSLGDRVDKRTVYPKGYAETSDRLATLTGNLLERDKLLAEMTTAEFRNAVENAWTPLRDKAEQSGASAKAMKIYRRQFEKIARFLADNTTLSISDMMQPQVMDRLARDIISLADISPGTGMPSMSKASLTKAINRMFDAGLWPSDTIALVEKLGITQGTLTKNAHTMMRALNDQIKFMVGDAAISLNEILGGDLYTSGIQGGYGNLVQDELDAVVRRDYPNKSESEIARERSSRVASKFGTYKKAGKMTAASFASEVATRFGVTTEKDFMTFKSFFSDDFSEIVVPASEALSGGLVDQSTLNMIGKNLFAGLDSIEEELSRMYGDEISRVLTPRKARGGRKALREHYGQLFDANNDEGAIHDLHAQGRIDGDELAKRLADRAKDRDTFIKNELFKVWDAEKQASKKARASFTAFARDLEKEIITDRMRQMGASDDQINAVLKRINELHRMDEWTAVRDRVPTSDAASIGTTLVPDATMESALKYQLQDLDKRIAELDRQARVGRSKYRTFSKGRVKRLRDTVANLQKERAQIAGELAEVQMQMRTLDSHVRPDVTHVDGVPVDSGRGRQILGEERDRLRQERELGNRRVRQIANRRVQRTMQRMADAGVMSDFEDNVRTPLARQIMDPKRRRREFLKATMTAGLMGSFNGQMRDDEIQARAMLLQDDPDRKIRDRDVRRQIKSNIETGATGGGQMSLFDQPVIDRDAPGRMGKAKTGLKGLAGSAKELGKGLKDVGVRGAALSAGQGVLNVATWAQPRNAIKNTGNAMTGLKAGLKHMDEMPGTMGRVGTAGKGLFQSFDMLSGGMLSVSGGAMTSIGALGPLIPILALVGGAALLLWKNWSKVEKGIGGGLDALGRAFSSIKDAVIEPFTGMLDSLNSEGEGMGSMWENIGKIINVAAHMIAKGLEFIAHPIRWIMELLAGITRVLIKTIQFLVAVFTLDWKTAWEALRDVVGTTVETIGGMIAEIPAALVDTLGLLLDMVENVADALPRSFLGKSLGTQEIADAAKRASDSVHGFADEIRDIPKVAGTFLSGNKKKAREEGNDDLEEYSDAVQSGDSPVTSGLEGNTDKAADAGNEEKKAYVEAFVGAFQGKMREVVDGWKQAALKAYDEWVEGQQAAIDTQIKGIEDLTAAEEKALKRREYLRRRAEMQNDMRVKKNQYILDREKLIYEGRYDEAAELDMQYNLDKESADRDFKQMEEEHQREVLLEEREGQIASLEQQQEANQKKYDAQRDALEKQLDAITEYIPKNTAEAKKMQEAILGQIESYTGRYGTAATMAQDAWRSSWSSAWAATTEQVAQDSFWSGQQALKQFAKGLGVDPGLFNEEFEGVEGTPPSGGHKFVDTAQYGRRPKTTASDGGRPMSGAFHTGGNVGNPSMSPSDVDATLQTGEYVIQRKSVAKYGKAFLDRLNEGQIYHTGGIVRKAFTQASSGAIGDFFANKAGLGGFTWQQVQNAYMNKLGMGGGQWMAAGDTSGMSVADIVDKVVKGIHPEFRKRLEMWNSEMGGKFDISRGYRSMAQQQRLYDRWINRVPGQAPAARPGRSMHNFGLAVDLSPSKTSAAQRAAGAKYGLRWPMGYEPWHVEPVEAREWRDMILSGKVPMGGGGLDQGIVRLQEGLFGDIAQAIPSSGDAKSIVRGMMAQHGWGPDQWPSLERLVQKESSWNPAAANRTSSARGLFQFLKDTWQSYITNRGGPPYWVQDVGVQARGGLAYIKSRYGSPDAALGFHNKHNWYHSGGIVVPKFHDGNYRIANTGLAEVARGEKIGYDDQMGGGDLHIHIGQFFGTDREIRKLGKEIERVMAAARRAKGNEPRSFNR